MATNEEVVAHIQLLGDLALQECNRRARDGLGLVIPSICIAQSAHETGWGTAPIMTRANAFFGIKAGGSWTGKVYVADTWEVAPNGEAYNTVANFRAYDSLEESVADYYNLIVNNSRYAGGVSYYPDLKSAEETIQAIWSGGYATDTVYPELIMNMIRGRNLTQWDSKINPANASGDSTGTTPGGGGHTYVPNTPSSDPGEYVRYIFEKI